MVIAGFIFVCAAISLAAVAFLKDYSGQDISVEYDAQHRIGSTPAT
jgi:hypothetical protein